MTVLNRSRTAYLVGEVDVDELRKKHICSECGAQFTRRSHLVRHARRHTGDRPYPCRYCSKAFGRSDTRAEHENSHLRRSIYAPAANLASPVGNPPISGGMANSVNNRNSSALPNLPLLNTHHVPFNNLVYNTLPNSASSNFTPEQQHRSQQQQQHQQHPSALAEPFSPNNGFMSMYTNRNSAAVNQQPTNLSLPSSFFSQVQLPQQQQQQRQHHQRQQPQHAPSMPLTQQSPMQPFHVHGQPYQSLNGFLSNQPNSAVPTLPLPFSPTTRPVQSQLLVQQPQNQYKFTGQHDYSISGHEQLFYPNRNMEKGKIGDHINVNDNDNSSGMEFPGFYETRQTFDDSNPYPSLKSMEDVREPTGGVETADDVLSRFLMNATPPSVQSPMNSDSNILASSKMDKLEQDEMQSLVENT